MDNNSNLPLIGRDISFSDIDQEVLMITYFGQLSKIVDGKVVAHSKRLPYGYLKVKGTAFKGPAMLAITHKDDFIHVWQALEERGVRDHEEALVVWTNTNYRNKVFKLLSGSMPKLVVWICSEGAHRLMHDNGYRPELSGEARYKAQEPLVEFKPEVML